MKLYPITYFPLYLTEVHTNLEIRTAYYLAAISQPLGKLFIGTIRRITYILVYVILRVALMNNTLRKCEIAPKKLTVFR